MKKGLVNVPTIEVTSGFAFTALIDRLDRINGLSVVDIDEMHRHAVCRYHDDNVFHIAEVMTNVFYHEWLYEYVESTLSMEGRQLSDDELEYVTIVFLHEIRASNLVIAGASLDVWMARTVRGFSSLLVAHKSISIDGFARFRLRGLLSALTSQVNEKVHQFILDREYEESVAMLRYMLDAQPQGPQELHVFCAPDRVWITDEYGDLLRDAEVTEAALSQSPADLDSEDLAMSILITRSPCRIVLHDMHPKAAWPSFPDTLVRVFAERARLCNHCSTCQQLEQAHYHLPLDASSDQSFRRNR